MIIVPVLQSVRRACGARVHLLGAHDDHAYRHGEHRFPIHKNPLDTHNNALHSNPGISTNYTNFDSIMNIKFGSGSNTGDLPRLRLMFSMDLR